MGSDVEFEGAERLLLEAEFRDARPLWYSSNYVYLCQLEAPTGEVFAAVYKPLKGESPLWDFPEGALYKREVAAYRLARLLDWNFIPPTVIREGPQGVGSLQVFISHDPESHFFVQRENEELVPQLQRMCVFDVVANNADRKGGHCLLDDEGTIWGIDHGLCFNPSYKLRSVIWDWVGEEIDEGWLVDLERVGRALAESAVDIAPLAALLTEGELDALGRRIRKLTANKVFPGPGRDRHYPWPLV